MAARSWASVGSDIDLKRCLFGVLGGVGNWTFARLNALKNSIVLPSSLSLSDKSRFLFWVGFIEFVDFVAGRAGFRSFSRLRSASSFATTDFDFVLLWTTDVFETRLKVASVGCCFDCWRLLVREEGAMMLYFSREGTMRGSCLPLLTEIKKEGAIQ